MATKALKDYKILVFDVYATLIDWETGIYTALQPLLTRQPDATSSQWTKKALLAAFSSVERDLQAKYPTLPYNELLARVYKALTERIALASAVDSTSSDSALAADIAGPSNDSVEEEGAAFARSLANWPPFPDTVEAMKGLKRLGYKLVILSNVDDASIKELTLPRLDSESYMMPTRPGTGGASPGEKNAKAAVDPLFTLVLTAQQLGAYKPDPRVLTSALEIIHSKLGVAKDDVLMVAQSLFHDHVPAKSLGLGTVWIDREGSEMGLDVAEGEKSGNGKSRVWDWRFKTLGEMVAAVEEEKNR